MNFFYEFLVYLTQVIEGELQVKVHRIYGHYCFILSLKTAICQEFTLTLTNY